MQIEDSLSDCDIVISDPDFCSSTQLIWVVAGFCQVSLILNKVIYLSEFKLNNAGRFSTMLVSLSQKLDHRVIKSLSDELPEWSHNLPTKCIPWHTYTRGIPQLLSFSLNFFILQTSWFHSIERVGSVWCGGSFGCIGGVRPFVNLFFLKQWQHPCLIASSQKAIKKMTMTTLLNNAI